MTSPNIVLYEPEYLAIKSILASVQSELPAELVLLINRSGQQIAANGPAADVDLTAMASLAAANLAATNCLAGLIGEREFSLLYHQGKRRSILISDQSRQFSLVLLFDDQVPLGRVRWKVKRAMGSIESVFRRFQEKMQEKRRTVGALEDITPKLFTDEDMEKLLGH
jgi:predicted regulator of Ras-like GTPase activity (Roadblock/LC7/MglB family)